MPSNAITPILQCGANLPDSRSNGYGNVISGAAKAVPSKVAKYFDTMVIPFLDEEKRKLAVLAIRGLIVMDKSIGEYDVVENVSGKTKNALQMQNKFVLSNFLAGVFLFVAQINNIVGKEYADAVNWDYVASFTELQDITSIVLSQRERDNTDTPEVFLTKAQALALVDKLDFRPDKPEIKQKFRDALNKTLYETHREFMQNQLMLTIMLMIYERYAEVPTKMHIFFREAFLAMTLPYNATKGAFSQDLKTGLDIDDVEKFLTEMCFYLYVDEKYKFTANEFEVYFDKLPKTDKRVKAKDFLYDLHHNLCLIYSEGDNYQFIHRSFQEYFAVLFMSRQTDEFIGKLASFFNKRQPRDFGNAFPMLYDIIPEKVEQFIFVPYLTELFNRCSGKGGYLNFLEEIYTSIHYSHGKVPIARANRPRSLIYEFLLRFVETDAYNNSLGPNDLPFYRHFIDDEVEYEIYEFLAENLVEHNQYKEIGLGTGLKFDVAQVRKAPQGYEELLHMLARDDFIFKREFVAMRKFLGTLNRKKERRDELIVLS